MPKSTTNQAVSKNPICQALEQTLQFLHDDGQVKPVRILLIAENHDYFQMLKQNFTDFDYQFYPNDVFNEIKFYQQYDVAILILNQPDIAVSKQNLQRCRDLFAKYNLVFNAKNSPLNPIEFGFRYFCQTFCQINQQNFNLYQFNLFDYKQLPDWLNSKFWANPENWDKFRW
ncbi:hypothetical protein MOMA_09106 [Moraxella macacae 0408225]|uniref:Uncharacterized protein n=1 Tax=Moraxella macacae 0408225 TaxID=1230338 RepID=L2F726_9GAMM|nr:DUF6231 family protein [Moraxella macacae]ELA08705.1 hypothetical protein MOMA_09106 [Moraxella macacae 0408225]